MTGRDLRNARPTQDEFGKWETSFTLSQDAAKRFGRFTESNINNKLAVVLDKQIFSVATIQNKIEDSGRITGIGEDDGGQRSGVDADLGLAARRDRLPGRADAGPSLGADSIHDGLMGIVGVSAVILVMLVYYKKAGINATLALILNAVILLAALAYFGAVLTLPGIAGFILTIGMAVDSNVLIFERIREELKNGKGVMAAVVALESVPDDLSTRM